MWTFGLLCVAFFLWILYRRRSFTVFKDLGIPGPEPNIFFGNILEIVQKTPLKCHEEWIQKYGKVVGYYFGLQPVVLVADVDMLKRIQVSDFHKFMNRPLIARTFDPKDKKKPPREEGFSQQLVALRDQRWKEVRSILTPAFTSAKMKTMVPLMSGAVDSFLEKLGEISAEHKSFDIFPVYQALALEVIGRTALGMQSGPSDALLRAAQVLFSADVQNPLVYLAVSFPGLQSVWRRLSKWRLRTRNKGASPLVEIVHSVKSAIMSRRANKQNQKMDLLQLMLEAEGVDASKITSDDLTIKDEESSEKQNVLGSPEKFIRKMTDDDILDNSVLFLLAGVQTTSTALAFTTHFLLHHPDVQEKARNEIKELVQSEDELNYTTLAKLQYLDQVLNESLRLYPPIYLLVTRECSEDMDFEYFRLKKGLTLQVSTYTIQRDPVLWDNAAEFHPERFAPENRSSVKPMSFQAFGNGPRNCVGMRFARMEMKLALARLLLNYRLQACQETEEEPIALHISSGSLHPKNGVWLKIIPIAE